MFEDEYQLNIDEEKKVEKMANIYSIIRTLDFIVSHKITNRSMLFHMEKLISKNMNLK